MIMTFYGKSEKAISVDFKSHDEEKLQAGISVSSSFSWSADEEKRVRRK